jgi:hypothetical protein
MDRKWFKKSYFGEMSSNISRTTSFFEGATIQESQNAKCKIKMQNLAESFNHSINKKGITQTIR